MEGKQRYLHIDVLKGIAILLVVLGHIYVFAWDQYNKALLFALLTSIHMPLFIMLSGYFMSKDLDLSMKGVVGFWSSKVIRLLLPLLFIPIFFDWVRYGVSTEAIPLKAIFMEYWFTSALFGLIALLYIFKVVVEPRRLSPFYLAVLAIAWAVVARLALLWIHDRIGINLVQMYLSKLSWLFPFFTLGYLMGRIEHLERWVRDQRIGAVAIAIYLAYLWYWYLRVENFSLVPLGLSFLGLIACYSLAYHGCNRKVSQKQTEPASRLTKILAYLGRESLPIYLTHYFFLPAMPWMKDFLDAITYRPQVFAWEFALGVLGGLMVLVPTLLVIRIIKCNKYLAMLLYGEEIKRDMSMDRKDTY